MSSRPAVITSPQRVDGRHVAVAAAAGLAAAMGIGRFVFTPLLPVMIASTGIGAREGALIATGNYAGYLLGAIALSVQPRLNTRRAFRGWSITLVASEVLMAVSSDVIVQGALRFVAGVASAAIFVACVSTVAHRRADGASPGVAFAGVGVGIALTGVFTVVGTQLSWQALWVGSGVLTALLLVPAWSLDVRAEVSDRASPAADVRPTTRPLRWAWRLLLVAYFLEGLGYIIVGTFLVDAVGRQGDSVSGASVWIMVGVAAAPATVLWNAIGTRIRMYRALVIALVVQAVSMAVPALSDGVVGAVVSAALFGGTFMGITTVAMAVGNSLPATRTAATLTAVYGVGQVLGPVLVAPVIGDSYGTAFAIACAAVTVAALAAVAVAILTSTDRHHALKG
ncbi:YbfB/YjiJ family MFS transporter [Rhodococcus sp. NPDC058521]|uniref:YbfB/YjiJ family MFS transporter n=1 Tax=Rhodococcus sp. NPDC058521 TaxID=3346536 RepID=UPI003665D790